MTKFNVETVARNIKHVFLASDVYLQSPRSKP